MNRVLCIVFAFLILLSGCSLRSNHLIEDSGKYYLDVGDKLTPYKDIPLSEPFIDGYIDCAVYFDSMDEMVADIESGTFTEDELKCLSIFEQDENERILLCDMSTLFVPTFPETYDRYQVRWIGTSYSYRAINSQGNAYSAKIYFHAEEEHNNAVNDLVNFKESIDVGDYPSEITIETEPERSATVYSWTYKSDIGFIFTQEHKVCIYSFERNGERYYVKELYESQTDRDVPTSIYIYATSGDQYFWVYVDTTERPSIEWLSSFGLEEYSRTLVDSVS